MKKLFYTVLAVFLMTAFLIVCAQSGYAVDNSLRQVNGELAYANSILKFKKILGLTDDQTKKLQTMASNEKGELEPLVKQMIVDLKYLNDKLNIGSKDEEIKPIIETINSNRQKMESIRNKYIDQSRDILTPTQQGKVILLLNVKRIEAPHGKKGKK